MGEKQNVCLNVNTLLWVHKTKFGVFVNEIAYTSFIQRNGFSLFANSTNVKIRAVNNCRPPHSGPKGLQMNKVCCIKWIV